MLVHAQAAYHGVPIVCVPHFGDQEMNAVKVISKVRPHKSADRLLAALLLVCQIPLGSLLICQFCLTLILNLEPSYAGIWAGRVPAAVDCRVSA